DSMPQGELAHEWELVADAVVGLDAEIGGAAHGRVAGARGDECDRDAGLAQQRQALAVAHVECLVFAAVAVVQHQAAVGERAVHVETGQAHAGGPGKDVGGTGGGGIECHLPGCHQTTRARSRSWMFSAPTTQPSPSTTISALILWSSIIRAASTASASLPMDLGVRVITASMRVLRRSMAASSSERRRSPSVYRDRRASCRGRVESTGGGGEKPRIMRINVMAI